MMMDAGSYMYPNANLWRMESLFSLIFRVKIHTLHCIIEAMIQIVLQILFYKSWALFVCVWALWMSTHMFSRHVCMFSHVQWQHKICTFLCNKVEKVFKTRLFSHVCHLSQQLFIPLLFLFNLFSYIENSVFSHTIYPECSFSSVYSSFFFLSPALQNCSLPVSH